MNYKLTILNLNCYLPEEAGGDEIYLKYAGNRIWPLDSRFYHITNETTPVNIEFPVVKGDRLTIELWEFDVLSANDHLGNLTIIADAHGHYTNEFTKTGKDRSKYALEWEIS